MKKMIEIEIPDEDLICPSCAAMQEMESAKPVDNPCFECGKIATENHHIIPKSLGGLRTIPLCTECHGKAHHDLNRMSYVSLRNLAREAKRKAGGYIGGKPQPWQQYNPTTKELEENPEGLATVLLFAKLYNEGLKQVEIVERLKEAGTPKSKQVISRWVKEIKDPTTQLHKITKEN